MLGEKKVKVIYIDLTRKKVRIEKREDLLDYTGGTGLGARLMAELLEKNPCLEDFFILANGPLNTIFPVATKVAAFFRSPITKGYGESHAGGRLALAMRFSGYDAVIVSGKSERPVYIVLETSRCRFEDAEAIWELETEESGRIMRMREGAPGHRSIIRIGAAGVRGVSFANVNVDTYRHFGRLGLGAVFGRMNLKGLVISGELDYPVPDKPAYIKTYKEVYDLVTKTNAMEKYHELGTAMNVIPLSKTGGLPTRNLRSTVFDRAEKISGEAFAEKTLIRKLACSGCPVGCIHIGLLRRFFARGYECESRGVSYDYELIFALGSMLAVDRVEDILDLIEAVETLGLDAISTGVILAWIMEATEKGLIGEKETGLPDLGFGNAKAARKCIEKIVFEQSEFYSHARKGLFELSRYYGGEEFAATVGRNETPGYFTGYASVTGFSVSVRNSHLDNAGYSIDQVSPELSPGELAARLVEETIFRDLLTSLHVCLFARKVYSLDLIKKCLRAIGYDYSNDDLMNRARKIFALKQYLRQKMGFDYSSLFFPARYFETEAMGRKLERARVEETVGAYRDIVDKIISEYKPHFRFISDSNSL